jgi:hypothetical protein
VAAAVRRAEQAGRAGESDKQPEKDKRLGMGIGSLPPSPFLGEATRRSIAASTSSGAARSSGTPSLPMLDLLLPSPGVSAAHHMLPALGSGGAGSERTHSSGLIGQYGQQSSAGGITLAPGSLARIESSAFESSPPTAVSFGFPTLRRDESMSANNSSSLLPHISGLGPLSPVQMPPRQSGSSEAMTAASNFPPGSDDTAAGGSWTQGGSLTQSPGAHISGGVVQPAATSPSLLYAALSQQQPRQLHTSRAAARLRVPSPAHPGMQAGSPASQPAPAGRAMQPSAAARLAAGTRESALSQGSASIYGSASSTMRASDLSSQDAASARQSQHRAVPPPGQEGLVLFQAAHKLQELQQQHAREQQQLAMQGVARRQTSLIQPGAENVLGSQQVTAAPQPTASTNAPPTVEQATDNMAALAAPEASAAALQGGDASAHPHASLPPSVAPARGSGDTSTLTTDKQGTSSSATAGSSALFGTAMRLLGIARGSKENEGGPGLGAVREGSSSTPGKSKEATREGLLVLGTKSSTDWDLGAPGRPPVVPAPGSTLVQGSTPVPQHQQRTSAEHHPHRLSASALAAAGGPGLPPQPGLSTSPVDTARKGVPTSAASPSDAADSAPAPVSMASDAASSRCALPTLLGTQSDMVPSASSNTLPQMLVSLNSWSARDAHAHARAAHGLGSNSGRRGLNELGRASGSTVAAPMSPKTSAAAQAAAAAGSPGTAAARTAPTSPATGAAAGTSRAAGAQGSGAAAEAQAAGHTSGPTSAGANTQPQPQPEPQPEPTAMAGRPAAEEARASGRVSRTHTGLDLDLKPADPQPSTSSTSALIAWMQEQETLVQQARRSQGSNSNPLRYTFGREGSNDRPTTGSHDHPHNLESSPEFSLSPSGPSGNVSSTGGVTGRSASGGRRQLSATVLQQLNHAAVQQLRAAQERQVLQQRLQAMQRGGAAAAAGAVAPRSGPTTSFMGGVMQLNSAAMQTLQRLQQQQQQQQQRPAASAPASALSVTPDTMVGSTSGDGAGGYLPAPGAYGVRLRRNNSQLERAHSSITPGMGGLEGPSVSTALAVAQHMRGTGGGGGGGGFWRRGGGQSAVAMYNARRRNSSALSLHLPAAHAGDLRSRLPSQDGTPGLGRGHPSELRISASGVSGHGRVSLTGSAGPLSPSPRLSFSLMNSGTRIGGGPGGLGSMITVLSTSPGLGTTGMLSTEDMSVQYDPNDPEVPAGEEQDQVRSMCSWRNIGQHTSLRMR